MTDFYCERANCMYVDYQHNDLAGDEASIRKTLTEALRFNDADLEINKTGKLSTRQMIRLSFQVLGPFAGLVSAAAGMVGLAVAMWVAGPAIMTHVRLAFAVGKYLLLGVGALFFGLVAFIMKLIFASGRVVQFLIDLAQGKVTSVNGRMNTSKSEEIEDGLNTFTKKKTETWNCVIKGEYFGINEEAFGVLRDRSGSIYRAYVTPRSRYLVAIEPSVADTGARDPFKLEYKSAS